MKFVLICHDDEPLTREGMARWIASFADLQAVIVISENSNRLSARIKKEIKRSGILGFLDVLAFRLYYKFKLLRKDRQYEARTLHHIKQQYPSISDKTIIFHTDSPNSPETLAFLQKLEFDFTIARCKTILKQSVFSLARKGTFVMHPGVCPEYRNAHGCFWAMVNQDYDNIGMTLLKVDEGIDTGPVYGYFGGDFDLLSETHNTIQAKVVFDNLPEIKDKFIEIFEGKAKKINVKGRKSCTWGQPWLTVYLRWKLSFEKTKVVK
ncbi:MAG: formyltransferase family protein [Colwellia sp.]